MQMHKLTIESVSPRELIEELAINNPPAVEERWFYRGNFDPTYGAKELRAAARKGWIELETHDEPGMWRLRLTPIGRQALKGNSGE